MLTRERVEVWRTALKALYCGANEPERERNGREIDAICDASLPQADAAGQTNAVPSAEEVREACIRVLGVGSDAHQESALTAAAERIRSLDLSRIGGEGKNVVPQASPSVAGATTDAYEDAVCGACGQPWTGEKCGQADNGWPHPVCYPINSTAHVERMREALRIIADIGEGSTTANSLPNIARIARGALNDRF